MAPFHFAINPECIPFHLFGQKLPMMLPVLSRLIYNLSSIARRRLLSYINLFQARQFQFNFWLKSELNKPQDLVIRSYLDILIHQYSVPVDSLFIRAQFLFITIVRAIDSFRPRKIHDITRTILYPDSFFLRKRFPVTTHLYIHQTI